MFYNEFKKSNLPWWVTDKDMQPAWIVGGIALCILMYAILVLIPEEREYITKCDKSGGTVVSIPRGIQCVDKAILKEVK